MNNAEKFKQLFGIYATELWAMPEVDFLKWLNEKVQLIQEDTTSDPIDRQAAIDAIEHRLAEPAYQHEGEDWYTGMNCAESELYDLPPAQPERWIPCSERLPEEGERVLATHLGGVNPNTQVIEHIYQCGKFTYGWDMDMNIDSPTFGQRYMGEVIAWMPLPEPWRGDSICK